MTDLDGQKEVQFNYLLGRDKTLDWRIYANRKKRKQAIF